MTYTIGEMAKKLGVAPSTLRYYDKEGLLPSVERSEGGVRIFQDVDMGHLSTIKCLKRTGMSIQEIRQYIDLSLQGDETIGERMELIDRRREAVLEQIAQLQDTLHTLDYKHWFYETALAAGTMDAPANMPLDQVPPKFRDMRKK